MLKVKLLHPDAKVPTRANFGDLGYDLYALEDTIIWNTVTKVRTGIAVAWQYRKLTEPDCGFFIKDRSSMGSKGLETCSGVVDAGYRGEVVVLIRDTMSRALPYLIKRGERIAQLIPLPVYADSVQVVEELDTTERGNKGFGSSGQ